jgi:hypothetical protein
VGAVVDASVVGLGWSIKESFVRYVLALPDGLARAEGGVIDGGPWGFLFPPKEAIFDPRTGDGTLSFGGGVRFRGHLGMMAVDVVAPTLVLREGVGTVSIAGASDTFATVEFEFRDDDERSQWLVHSVLLTEIGAARFGGVYQPGDPLAPMAVSLARRVRG